MNFRKNEAGRIQKSCIKWKKVEVKFDNVKERLTIERWKWKWITSMLEKVDVDKLMYTIMELKKTKYKVVLQWMEATASGF